MEILQNCKFRILTDGKKFRIQFRKNEHWFWLSNLGKILDFSKVFNARESLKYLDRDELDPNCNRDFGESKGWMVLENYL
jgi:prophage antirepressor-like protein